MVAIVVIDIMSVGVCGCGGYSHVEVRAYIFKSYVTETQPKKGGTVVFKQGHN